FVSEDGRHDEVANRAKGRADHVVEARLLRGPLAQVHATVRHLVGVVHALEGVLMELRLGALREAGRNVDNHNGHGSSPFDLLFMGAVQLERRPCPLPNTAFTGLVDAAIRRWVRAASGSYNATTPSTSSALALVGKQARQILRIQGRVSLIFALEG